MTFKKWDYCKKAAKHKCPECTWQQKVSELAPLALFFKSCLAGTESVRAGLRGEQSWTKNRTIVTGELGVVKIQRNAARSGLFPASHNFTTLHELSVLNSDTFQGKYRSVISHNVVAIDEKTNVNSRQLLSCKPWRTAWPTVTHLPFTFLQHTYHTGGSCCGVQKLPVGSVITDIFTTTYYFLAQKHPQLLSLLINLQIV